MYHTSCTITSVLGPIPSKDLNGKHKQITSMLMNITNMSYNILEQTK